MAEQVKEKEEMTFCVAVIGCRLVRIAIRYHATWEPEPEAGPHLSISISSLIAVLVRHAVLAYGYTL